MNVTQLHGQCNCKCNSVQVKVPKKVKSSYTPAEIVALGERLRAERGKAGLTQQQLAERAGCSKGWISQIESGSARVAEPGLRQLADALGIPLDALDGRERATPLPPVVPGKRTPAAYAHINSGSTEDAHARIARSPEGHRLLTGKQYTVIPVRALGHCNGNSPALLEPITMATWTGETMTVEGNGYGIEGIKAEGDSMEPDIRDGDRVAYNKLSAMPDCAGQTVVAVYLDEQDADHTVVKRCAQIGDTVVLASLNPKYKPLRLPITRVKYLWKVVEISRRL